MTIENNDSLTSEEAQEALNTINEMERTSLKQSIPPLWFGLAIASTIGAMVFTFAAGLRDYYVFPIIAIPLILAVRAKKTQAMPKTLPVERKGIIAMISIFLILIGLIAGGCYFMEIYKLLWAPIVVGAIAALLVCLLSIVERNEYLTKIDGE